MKSMNVVDIRGKICSTGHHGADHARLHLKKIKLMTMMMTMVMTLWLKYNLKEVYVVPRSNQIYENWKM